MKDVNKLDELRELVDFLKANGIAEFDMERTDLKVRIKFAGAAGPSAADVALAHQMIAGGGGGGIPSPHVPVAAAEAAVAAAAAVAEAHPDQAADYGSHYCKTAYHASCDGSHVGG